MGRGDGRKRKPSTAPSKKDLVAQEHLGLMVDMRVAGKSLKQIADFIGIPIAAVHEALTEELSRRDKDIAERAGELRYIENERLDKMHEALKPGLDAGDPASINAALNVMNRRARLFALDRPQNLPTVVTPTFILPGNIDVKGTEFEQPSD